MAVTPGYVSTNNITWAASTTATVSSASIGTASADRVVVVAVTVEDNVTINSATLGGTTMKLGPSAVDTGGTPDDAVRFFYLPFPTGTTANIVVTLSASSSQTGRVSVWAMTGAYPVHSDSNTNTGSGATITLTGVTVPTNGAGFWVWANATTGTAVAWTNATERDDSANTGATYRHSVADTTTAGTLTITADGANAAQAIAGMAFEQLPAVGWDALPQMEKAAYRSRTAALALIASGLVWAPQPIVQLETGPQTLPAKAEVTTSRRGTRTLYYQSWVRPPAPPVAAASNLTTSIDWLRPFDRPLPRRWPAKTNVTLPAQPPAAAASNLTTSIEWLRPFDRAVPRRWPAKTNVTLPAYPYTQAVADTVNAAASVTAHWVGARSLLYQSKIEPVPQPTAEVVVVTTGWYQPFGVPPLRLRMVGRQYAPFVPTPVVQVTVDEWLQPFRRNVAGPFPQHTQPVLGLPPAAAPTADEWLTPFSTPPRKRLLLASGSPFIPEEAVLENTVPPGWMQPWRGPPRELLPLAGGPVYAAAPAVEDNTQTIDKWQLSWNLAAKATTPIHTQPFYGFPYEGVDNTRFEWDWHIQWRGPPRYLPPKLYAQPFVPREAVLENTVSVDQYLFRFQKAVPRSPVWATQPFYGFPYEGVDNTRTEWDWHIQWRGPPRIWPLGKPYQPFVPKEAVLENTQTPDKWLQAFKGPPRYLPPKLLAQPFVPKEATAENTVTPDKWLSRFDKPVPRGPVWATQPFFGYPYVSVFVDNTVTIDKWLVRFEKAVPAPSPIHTQPFFGYPYVAAAETTIDQWLIRWNRAPRYQRPRIQAQPFVPREATLENTVTPDKWLQAFKGPPRYRPPKIAAQPFVAREATAENTVSLDKWLQRFFKAVPRPPVWATQPFYGYPYIAALFVEGGPADESERVACVPASSRTATEPGLLRTVTVPLDQRSAIVPELLRVVEVPDQSRVVNSNDYRDRPCHDT